MKRCSTLLTIGKMCIKTMMRYYYTPIRMAKIKYIASARCCQGYWATGTLILCWKGCKIVQTLWKRVWQFLTKLNNSPTSIYSIEMVTYIHTKAYTWTFVVALFMIAQNWKQPKCPSTYEWHTHTVEQYSAIKGNKL